MNTFDKVVTALTPGSIFNRNGLIFRSTSTLAEFAGIPVDEILELLNGDMAALITCKPSKKGKGILVALTEHIPTEATTEDAPGAYGVYAAGPGDAVVVEPEVQDELPEV